MKCNTPKNIKSSSNLTMTSNVLKYLTKQNRFQEGEVVYVTDTEKFMVYKDAEWIPLEAQKVKTEGNSQGIQMTAYELNKQLISQMPIPTDLTNFDEIITEFKREAKSSDFMLLCKERSYYTVFRKTDDSFSHFIEFGEAVLTCASDLGDVITVDKMDETNTVEIWVKNKDTQEVDCMVLFESNDFIVTYTV